MGKFQAAKNHHNNNRNHNNRNLWINMKPNKKQKLPPPTIFEFDDGADSADDNPLAAGTPKAVHRLLEPYSKDQLIGFLLDAAALDPALLDHIKAVADADVAHRKLFVHGLDWQITRDDLLAAFRPFGPVEECNVVLDKATGRSKGYGFVLFASRAAAVKALEQPQRKIKNRLAYCQLASIGPAGSATTNTTPAGGSTSAAGSDVSERRIYVSNVHTDVMPEKLKAFFSQFGEIESGPSGFDMITGKSRGFAIFIFRTKEGAKKVLEEPYKMFEGHQLHCKLAFDHKKGKTPALATNATSQSAVFGTVQQPGLNTVAAAQNLAFYGQNPAFAALFAHNPLLAAAALNPAAYQAAAAAATLHPAAAAAFNTAAVAALNPAAVAAALNPAAGLLAAQGHTLNSLGIGGSSLLGGYGSQVVPGIHGLQSYHGSQVEQSSSTNIAGSYRGFAS